VLVGLPKGDRGLVLLFHFLFLFSL
jgi:hypothetical protein